jgi:integrase
MRQRRLPIMPTLVLALRWKDVDLAKGIVRIEHSLEQTKAGLRFKAPKTKNGRRNISISPWLVAELRSPRSPTRATVVPGASFRNADARPTPPF